MFVNFAGIFCRLAQQVGIPNFKKLPKDVLFVKLQEQYDMDRLLRTEARREKIDTLRKQKKRKVEDAESSCAIKNTSTTVSNPRPKKVKLNTIDPIMFEPIGNKKTCFKFARPNGTVVRFNIESLVDYLLASGDFNDPETRIPFSDTDLAEIDAIVRSYSFSFSFSFIVYIFTMHCCCS